MDSSHGVSKILFLLLVASIANALSSFSFSSFSSLLISSASSHLLYFSLSNPKFNLSNFPKKSPRLTSCGLNVGFQDIVEVIHNKVLIAAGILAAIGQLSKPFTSVVFYGKNPDFRAVFQAGGFPSTHSSTFACGRSLTQAEQEKVIKKKKKDCPETKRPSSSYVLWCKEQWSEIKKQNPQADFKETSNILGAKWKALSAEDKKPYEEKYQIEKEAYFQIVSKEKR